jgi:hypothetical protein
MNSLRSLCTPLHRQASELTARHFLFFTGLVVLLQARAPTPSEGWNAPKAEERVTTSRDRNSLGNARSSM